MTLAPATWSECTRGAALVAYLLLASCAQGQGQEGATARTLPPVQPSCAAQIDAAARLYLAERAPTEPTAQVAGDAYASGAMDLNDDGYLDAVVVEDSCTEGNGQVLVLGGTEDGLELISRGTLSAYRVSASRHKTNGWYDLIVRSDNTAHPRFSLLRFDGLGYAADVSSSQDLSTASPSVRDGWLLVETHDLGFAPEARSHASTGG